RVLPRFGDGLIVEVAAQGPIIQWASVRMRAVDEDVCRGDPGCLASLLACTARNVQGDADQVAENERRPLIPVGEEGGLGQERIVRSGVEPVVEIAAHAVILRRRDIHDGNPRLKIGGGDKSGKDGDDQQNRNEATLGIIHWLYPDGELERPFVYV